MNQERWNRIEEILQAALDVDTAERAAFVRTACGSDTDLHRDVTALLASGSDVLLLDPPRHHLTCGQEISHYRIEGHIGAGGMAEVYRAQDERLRRTVALKALPPEFVSDRRRLHRFEQEAFAASRLNHPNIVTIFETVDVDDAHLIATEFIEGQTLRTMLTNPVTGKPRKLPMEAALDIAVQVAAALQAAHTAWIIHRDIKPENIMIRSDGLVKVLDFGIAKLSEVPEATEPGGAVPDVPRNPRLTLTGAVLGTSMYMSPEQSHGEPLDGRTDIFSLGVVLKEMLPSSVPKPLERVLHKMLAHDRNDRYTSTELVDELKRVKRRLEGKRARRLIGISGLTAIIALALTAVAAILSVSETWEERILRDGHTAAARRAVFSPDGRLVASCSEDGRVIVWDFARRQRVATLAHPAYYLAFAPDGHALVTGGVDGSIVVWDAATWRRLRTLTSLPSEISALAFSPDGALFAAMHFSGMVLWDARRWERLREWNHVGGSYGTLLFSPDSRQLVSSFGFVAPDLQHARFAKEWDVGAQLALSPDHTRFATVLPDGSVGLYRVIWRAGAAQAEPLDHRRAHQDHGRAVAFSPDGRLFATGADDIIVWDAATRQKVARFEYSSIVWSIAFSPDGRWLISSHGDGAVLIWDVAERALAGSLNEHSAAVRAVAFSRDGKRLASGSEDRTIILWDVERGAKQSVLFGHQTRVAGVAFAPDDTTLASVDQDGVTILWDLASGRPRLTISLPVWSPNYCVAVSPDGRHFATTQGLYTPDGRKVVDFRPEGTPYGNPYGVAFSPDGRLLAAVCDLGFILLCDVERHRLVQQLRVPNSHQISVSFAPDSKTFVTGSDEGLVRLWSVSPIRELGVVGRHTARVKSVAFAPDGRTIASAGDDKMVALWDVRSRTLRAHVGTHTSPVYAVAFSADGSRLATGEHDRSVRIYTRRRSLWRFTLQ